VNRPCGPGFVLLSLLGLTLATACRDFWGIQDLPTSPSDGGGGTSGAASGGTTPCARSCRIEDNKLIAQRCSDGEPQNATCAQGLGETQNARQCDPQNGTCMTLLMDETEVTEGSYRQFLGDIRDDESFDLARINHSECSVASATDLEPPTFCKPSCTKDCDNHPQVCVDWCDAWAYCSFYGQYLCGSLYGATESGAASTDWMLGPESGDAKGNAWVNACSAGGYDDDGYAKACKVEPAMTSDVRKEPMACATSRVARPGYSRFLGLQGNVSEWTNDCRIVEGESQCAIRGGSYDPNSKPACEDRQMAPRQTTHEPTLGFRCCGSRHPPLALGGSSSH
jgi:hypothetical protein